MGRALAGGLLRSGWIEPGDLTVAERHEETREELVRRFPDVQVTAAPVPAGSAVLAVKPADAAEACDAMRQLQVARVMSIVAGVRIGVLEEHLGADTVVLRAMPNLPAVIGAGASGLAGGRGAAEGDYAWGEAVLSAFGVVARMPEHLLDAVTGLSGSGPAYVFLLAEAMIEAAVWEGLDREVAHLLTVHTLLGSARMLAELGDPVEDLRARVTSPGGTTAAGVRELERRGFRSAVIEAVAAASERARQLGQQTT